MKEFESTDVNNNSTNTQPRRYHPVKSESFLKQKWFAIGCLTPFILLMVISLVSLSSIAMLSRRRVQHLPAGTFLHLRLSGIMEEHRELDQDILSFTKTLSVREIISKINQAADDPNIYGIILEPSFVSAGYSALNELTLALNGFKERGKPIYAYLELASNRDYYLASVATEIFLNPSASSGIYLSGVGITSLYMQEMFAKLGIEWTILHSGEFKGAGEEFSRNEMSPQMRQSLTMLLDDLYSQLLNDLADKRSLDFDKIRKVYEERTDFFINREYALDLELVDYLSTKEDMLIFLGVNDNRIVKISKYRSKPASLRYHSQIAIVYLQGSIAMSSGNFGQNVISAEKVKKIIDDIEQDPAVKAVVLRINSPGGSALESEKIYHQLKKLQATKPVIVSMGDMAASGGYYIAALGDYIFADPYTITGSIGVASLIPNFYQTGQKIGVNSQTISRGKYTNFMNLWERPNPSDIAALQRSMDSTYEEFKSRVSEGRSMSLDSVEKVAQGRIWSSRRALDSNLIDAVGTLDQAIEKAAELANLSDYRTIYLPETQTIWEMLLERRFDSNVITGIIKRYILADERIEYIHHLYSSIKNDPVQMLSPIIFVD